MNDTVGTAMINLGPKRPTQAELIEVAKMYGITKIDIRKTMFSSDWYALIEYQSDPKVTPINNMIKEIK